MLSIIIIFFSFIVFSSEIQTKLETDEITADNIFFIRRIKILMYLYLYINNNQTHNTGSINESDFKAITFKSPHLTISSACTIFLSEHISRHI